MLLGIDLGTDTIKICDKNNKIMIAEKNMIAIRDGLQVIGIGDDAYEMYEKTPVNVHAGCPMMHGAIADAKNMELLLVGLLRRCSSLLPVHPTIYIAVPSDISAVEKRAYYNVLSGNIKAKKICLVDKGVADAIGIGLPIDVPVGNMVVNIGADTTDISVLTGGQILLSKMLQFGGRKLDEDISTMVRRMFQLNIGMRTADKLKNALAYIIDGPAASLEVYGISTVSGLPKSAVIPSLSVSVCIMETIDNIVQNIKSTLNRIPPQFLADIRKNGIYLSGGVSGIPNLADYMRRELEVPIYLVREPVTSTLRGLLAIMNHKELEECTYSLKDLTGNTI